jgi:hypothetical protein
MIFETGIKSRKNGWRLIGAMGVLNGIFKGCLGSGNVIRNGFA